MSDEPSLAELLGAAIRAERVQRGMTQAELAKLAGVPQRRLSRWETGEARIRLEGVLALARALDMRPGVIFDVVFDHWLREA